MMPQTSTDNTQHLFNIFLIGLLLLTSSCSTKLLTGGDYEESLHHHYAGSAQKALKSFPKKEDGFFITTLEKAYLKQLKGQPDLPALLNLAKSIEKRIRYQGSREVQSLFYAEMPEGYYASEHEIIWLHLLLSWGFSSTGEFEKGCVEARKASHLLSAPWSHEGRFDDSMLRILLGGLWTMCGSWEDAQVDFRKAVLLAPETTWLKELIALEDPPENLFLLLGGVGPLPVWDPSAEFNPLRGLRNLAFTPQGQRSQIELKDKKGDFIPLFLSPDSSHWYQRHFERDNAIHELIVDSQYTGKAAGSVTVESAKMAASYALGTTLIAGSIALGGGIVYLSVLYLTGDALGYGIGAGFVLAGAGSMKGINIMVETTEESLKTIQKDLDPSDSYRFVRFLPEYLWMGWNNREAHKQSSFRLKADQPPKTFTRIKNNSSVLIGHYSDVDLKKSGVFITSPVAIKWKSWREKAELLLSNHTRPTNWTELQQHISTLVTAAKSSQVAFRLEVNNQKHRIQVSQQKIEGGISKGIFTADAVYQIDLRQKKITASRDAMDSLLNTLPHQFLHHLFQKIDQETNQIKRRR